jgi:hypothetical protein
VAEALTREGQPSACPQPGDSRGVDGHYLALGLTQTHGRDRQVGNTPRERVVKQRIEDHPPTFHRALDTVPAPVQLHDKRQSGTGQAAFVVDQPTGHHNNQDHTNAKGGARRQQLDQTMYSSRSKVDWIGARLSGEWDWLFHTPSIPGPGA